ncbi:hypothetical protein BZZ01_09675 [Nostocales cyanobacterium HT-58-2]|nr:hypothetical protein BZZ01_09675 [Nostocales cyanobacterium HT-58-2]
MSMMYTQNDELSPQERRALVAQLLKEKANKLKSLFPLSQGQQALWFLYKLAPQSWAYNTLFTVRIRSEVDISALRRAFQVLIERHPSLRTTYTECDNKPIQQIHENIDVDFEEIDASTWNWDELKEYVATAARYPFNLEQGPVFRVRFFTRSPEDHVLMFAIHHIASDLWSHLVLMDELRALYPAENASTSVSLPSNTLSYVEYVIRQNKMLAGSAGDRLWAYWQQQLSGDLPILDLPTDRPRPLVQSYQGASITFKLTKELTQQLKVLAKTEKATLYMILLAAFQVLLYRYTGQEDVLVGSPTFGRSQREFTRTIGYFVNPVVLRADLSNNPTFKAFLAQVRRTVLGAIAHQDYPFPLLVERLQPNRSSSHLPVFQVMFALQKLQQFQEAVNLLIPDEEGVQIDWGGLKLEPFGIVQEEGQFDLTLDIVEGREFLTGVYKYRTDLFDACTICRMAEHFQTLLEGIVAYPELEVSKLPLLTEGHKQQLLAEWNHPVIDYPDQVCIHQLFEAQVAQTPDAVAVVHKDQCLTYSQLNSRANQLAHYLHSLGVKPDHRVGLCIDTSFEMVVAMLAILKAGAAYIPLDSAYPPERLAFMLADAQVLVLLTQQHLVDRLPQHSAQFICLDTDWHNFSLYNRDNLNTDVTADNLAYVIYTSGSTGNPKGVLVEHRSLVNYTFAIIQALGIQASDPNATTGIAEF